MKILTINPGSTSTKIGAFEDESLVFEKTLRHETEEIAKFEKIADQFNFRKELIEDAVKEAQMDISDFDAIVGRGGLVKPIEGGTYEVNDRMIEDLKSGVSGQHASNLGGLIAHEIAVQIGKKAYIVDPVVVDELSDISRISGHPAIQRKSIFHALNQKAIAKQFCKETGKDYKEVTLIVVHMGGGVSVGIHKNGKVQDVNNALDGEGPFSPERSGGLPVGDLTTLCFSGKYTEKDIRTLINGKGGMVAYVESNNMKDLEERSRSDEKIKLLIDAMVYQISKEIGAVSTFVCGKVDAILLTGGIAYSNYITDEITKRVSFIAEVKKYPGEDELSALAKGALRVMNGEETAKVY